MSGNVSGGVQSQPTRYRVGLALGGGSGFGFVEAIVFDLPGCFAVAPDRAAALVLVPVTIAEHVAWLDGHGHVTRDAFPFEVDVVEEVEVGKLAAVAEGEFVFEDDRRATSTVDLETSLRRMAFARRDLLALVRPLPNPVLDWLPPASAVRRDSWAPDIRSIRGILEHIASGDGYYAGNVGDDMPAGLSQSGPLDLFDQRGQAVERLRGLSQEERSHAFKRRQPWQKDGHEYWTVRKALRRFISHERFHTKEIEQRLAWLLVGAPTLRGPNTHE